MPPTSTYLVLDVLEPAVWTRARDDRGVSGLVHHSDRGMQCLALRYTERLDAAGADRPLGTRATPITTSPPSPSAACTGGRSAGRSYQRVQVVVMLPEFGQFRPSE